MKTKVTFKALRRGRIVHKTIPIEHPDFGILPSEIFDGVELPSISIESQVIDYLDSIDKADMMAKNDWDVILDYYPHKRRKRKNEIEDFIEFMRPYVDMFPELARPIEAVMSEAQGVLFGHRKSNETKARELIKMLSMTLLASKGTLDTVMKYLDEYKRALKSVKASLMGE